MIASPRNTHQRGFTLTELIVVIVVIAFAGVALLQFFSLTRANAPTPAQITLAEQLAQERMELILGTRHTLGFNSIVDPCASGTPTPCTTVSGYTITVRGVPSGAPSPDNWPADANPLHFRQVTVTVTGPTGDQLSSLVAVLGNY
jgi:prepilin-type N-terminal cleavage/methylation domain-containing protein